MTPTRDRLAAVEPEPTAVRAARRSVGEFLDDFDDDTCERALLCTSELVTNAIEHGEPPVVLHVAANGDRSVRIEVHDASDRPLRPRHPSAAGLRGRGLLVVDRCTDRWGVHADREGKTVWCELSPLAS